MLDEMDNFFASMEVIQTVIIVIACIIISVVINRYFRRKIVVLENDENASSRKLMLNSFFRHLLIVITCIIAGVCCLKVNGVNINSLLASLGIASAVIGLAFQDWIKDIIMGIHIIIDHFFDVGNIIEYDGDEFEVISFNINSTKLKTTSTGAEMTICNHFLSNVKVLSDNFYMSVCVSRKENTSHVESMMTDLCGRIVDIEEVSECRYIGIQNFLPYAVEYKLHIKCEPKDKYEVRRKINGKVQEFLVNRGVSVISTK